MAFKMNHGGYRRNYHPTSSKTQIKGLCRKASFQSTLPYLALGNGSEMETFLSDVKWMPTEQIRVSEYYQLTII